MVDHDKIIHPVNFEFRYDYILKSDQINDTEIENVLNDYFGEFKKILTGVAYEYFKDEDSVYELLSDCKRYVDETPYSDISFHFDLWGFGHILPLDMLPSIRALYLIRSFGSFFIYITKRNSLNRVLFINRQRDCQGTVCVKAGFRAKPLLYTAKKSYTFSTNV